MRITSLICLMTLTSVSVTASAHAYLVGSKPADQAVLAKPPREMHLRFSEPLEPDFVSIHVEIEGKQQGVQPTHVLSAEGREVIVPLPVLQDMRGNVAVLWEVVARDGHRSKGRVRFTLKNP